VTERCPRCHKALEYDGESWSCRHCGFHDCMPAMGKPMTRGEVKQAVAELRQRPPLSPKCRGRLHHLCQMPGCGCPHHERTWDGHPPSRLCGSRRNHGPHYWTGQTTGQDLMCPGYSDRGA
jgi:hypothetical protein